MTKSYTVVAALLCGLALAQMPGDGIRCVRRPAMRAPSPLAAPPSPPPSRVLTRTISPVSLAHHRFLSHNNNHSKTTYSSNDPLACKAFLSKYFNVATAPDECAGDICACDATATQPAWQIQQGRVYTT